MQTPKLLIVAIRGTHDLKEVDNSANGLYNKYSARHAINKEVQLVFLSRRGEVVEPTLCKGSLTIEETDNLGIYIVAHYGDFGMAVGDHDLVANIKKNVLEDKTRDVKQYTLDKVCLVVCNSAKDATPKLSEANEGVLILKFANQLDKAGLRPRLAGWKGFVTVDKDTGKKQILSSKNFQIGNASDMSQSRALQKLVYIYDVENGYMIRDLASWTDKK